MTGSNYQISDAQKACDKLVKKTSSHEGDGNSAFLLKICKTILNDNTPEDHEDPVDLLEQVRELLPTSSQLLTRETPHEPIFPITHLQSVLYYFGCATVNREMRTRMGLTKYEMENKAITSHAWLLWLHKLPTNEAKECLNYVREARGASFSWSLTRNDRSDYSSEGAQSIGMEQDERKNYKSVAKKEFSDNEQLAKEVKELVIEDEKDSEQMKERSYKETISAEKKITGIKNNMRDEKFSGDFDESVHDTMNEFEEGAKECRLTEEEKAHLFGNAFRGEAKRECRRITDDGMSREQKLNSVICAFDGPDRQQAVMSKLESITLGSFMKEKEIDEAPIGLKNLAEWVANASQQAPKGFRTESHKVRHLRRAVLGRAWSKNPICNISASDTLQSFKLSLFRSLNEEIETKEKRVVAVPNTTVPTLCGQCVRNPRDVRKRDYPAGASPKLSAHNNAKHHNCKGKKCFKCGAAWFRGHRCPPGAIKTFLRQHAKSDRAALVNILGEFAAEAEEDNAAPAEPEIEEPDEECLTNLLDSVVNRGTEQSMKQVDEEILMGHMEAPDPHAESFRMQDPNLGFRQSDMQLVPRIVAKIKEDSIGKEGSAEM